MSLRRLLIAVVVLAALGGGLWWSKRHPKTDESKTGAETATTKVVAIPDDQITELDFVRKDTPPTVVKRSAAAKWEITAPKTLPVDNDVVQGVTSALTSLSADQVVEEKAGDLAPFGLNAPSFTLIVTKKDGKKQEIQLGDEAPTSGLVYAKVSGDPKVYALSTSLKSSLDKNWQDLRDKRLLTFDQDKVTRVELTAKKQSVEFGRNAQNDWQILKPKPYRADGWQVEEVIRKLKDAKLDSAASDEDARKAAAAFASGTPVAVAKVTDASGTQTLDVRKNKDDYYAKSNVVEGAYKVSSDLGTGLDKGLDDFRNKKLFDFGFSDPNKFEVRDDGKPLVSYQKSGEKWTSGGKEMDSATVQQFIDKLRDLQASKFAESGFSVPIFEVAVTSNDGKRNERVQISKTGDTYYAKRENEPSIYELDAKAAGDLISGAGQLKPASPASAKKK